jgi:radical SAM/Cys-rich protein
MDENQPSFAELREELHLDSLEAGPKGARSLLQSRSPLAAPAAQLELLAQVPLAAEFDQRLADSGWSTFRPGAVEYFQINIGKLCNMACRHCHVDASPDRIVENMGRELILASLSALDQTSAHTVDITGGAPELNPHFPELVEAAVSRGMHVIDRNNLTILLLPRFEHLPDWLGERGVEVVASLPHPRARNTDAQRGEGAFDRSIAALRRLNAAGYGKGDPRRRLTLMHNPAGAFLPAASAGLEAEYRRALDRPHGVTFDRLIALNNMPISRFLDWLRESGNLEVYLQRLADGFNPATIAGLMCRNTLSVSWDGTLYDCDFNQMLDLPILDQEGRPANVKTARLSELGRRRIVTARHCFGCTAGSGSSCGGATA